MRVCKLPPHRRTIFQFTAIMCVNVYVHRTQHTDTRHLCARRREKKWYALSAAVLYVYRVKWVQDAYTSLWESEQMEMRVIVAWWHTSALVYLHKKLFAPSLICIYMSAHRTQRSGQRLRTIKVRTRIPSKCVCGLCVSDVRVLSATTQRDLIRWKVNCKISHERNYVPLSVVNTMDEHTTVQ